MKIKLLLYSILFSFSISTLSSQNLSLDWVKQFSGSSDELVYDLEIDANGNIFTFGQFDGTVDFDPGAGVNSLTATSLFDGFVKKLDPNGDLVWVRQLTGGEFLARDIEITANNELIMIGSFRSSIDINLQTAGMPLTNQGNLEVFTLILDTNGNFMSAAKYDGSDFGYGMDIAYKSSNNIRWDVGYFRDTLFNRGVPAAVAGTTATFLSSGGQMNIIAGSGQVSGTSADLSTRGSLFAVGIYTHKVFPPVGMPFGDTLEANGGLDYFIYKQHADGSPYWLKGIKGNATSIPRQIQQDPKDLSSGNRTHSLYIAGSFSDTVDFDPDTGNTSKLVSRNSSQDVFLQKLDTSGNLIWAKSFGGNRVDRLPVFDTDEFGNVYLAGIFKDTADFDPSAATANLVSTGGFDIFLLKLDSSGNFMWAVSFGGTLGDHQASGIKVVNNSIYLTGQFQDSIDFDPTTGVNSKLSQNGSLDVFVLKLTDGTVGIKEANKNDQLKLYPNPSQGMIKVDNSSGAWNRLDVLDLQGRILFSEEALSKDIIDLQLSDLPNGTYLMRMEGDQMSTVQKFVVKK